LSAWREDKLWKEQKRFIIATAAFGFFFPLLFFLFFDLLINFFSFLLIIILPTLFLGFVLLKSIETHRGFLDTLRDYCTFIPIHYAEGESLLERRFNATYALILTNVFVHYAIELLGPHFRELVESYFACLPDHLEIWNVALSPLTAMFLHGDAEHLWGNMVFLWIFGLVLERRIGWQKFLLIYFVTGLFSSIIPPYLHLVLFQDWYSALGASGAISGIMGAFAFRLFYKRMVFPFPILGLFSLLFGLNLKVRINSLMLIMTYFFFDFLGSLFQLSGVSVGIDYLGHLSATLLGMYLASRLKFEDVAMEEMMLERALTAVDEKGNNQLAEKYLQLILEKNPERWEAMVPLARIKNRFGPTEEGERLYLKAISLLIDREPEKAAEIFAEYFGLYHRPLEAPKQYLLTEILEKLGKYGLAARALEILADDPATPEAWRPRILYRAARLLEKQEFYEAACYRYEQLLQKYPDFKEAEKIRFKLERLKTVRSDTTWLSYVKKASGGGSVSVS